MRYQAGEVKVRRRSKVENYFHLAWATKGRRDFLTPAFERRVHRCIVQQAQELGAKVLAVGGMPDHVHLVVRLPGQLAPAVLVKQIKGAASLLYNELRPEYSEPFHWQDGYASFTLWHTQVAKAVAYVHDQKRHHAAGAGSLYEPFEQFYEVVPDVTVAAYVFPDEG